MDCSTIADRVIESIAPWPEAFVQKPLLRSAIEFGIAWAFAKWQRGDYGFCTSGTFANEAFDIVHNGVIGRIDLIDDGDLAAIRERVTAHVIAVFEVEQETVLVFQANADGTINLPATEMVGSDPVFVPELLERRAQETAPQKPSAKKSRPAARKSRASQ